MPTTIEFFKKANTILVIYNHQQMTLMDFLKNQDISELLNSMYHKIFTDYYALINSEVKNMSIKSEVVAAFIKKFFLKKDFAYDVILFGEGNRMKFNLEK